MIETLKEILPENEYILYDYDVNIKNRSIHFSGEITIHTPNELSKKIFLITDISNDFVKPINLYMSSWGGDVYGALGIIDLLNIINVPINIIGIGAVMSAAVLVLACASGKRYMTKNATCMIHEISTWVGGNVSSFEVEMKELQRLENLIFNLMEQHTKKSINFWKQTTRYVNKFLDPKECKKYGIIDRIL